MRYLNLLLVLFLISHVNFAHSAEFNICDRVGFPHYPSQKRAKYRGNTVYVEERLWDNSAIRNEIVDAAEFWNESLSDGNKIVLKKRTNQDRRVGNSYFEIYTVSLSNGNDLGRTGVLLTGPSFDNGRCYLKEADIQINRYGRWTLDDEYGSLDGVFARHNLGLFMVHEFGHLLGFADHRDNVKRTMNTLYPNGGPIGRYHDTSPHPADLGRLNYLYDGTTTDTRDVASSNWYKPGARPSDTSISINLLDNVNGNEVTQVQRNKGYIFPTPLLNRSRTTKDVIVTWYMSPDTNFSFWEKLGTRDITIPGYTEVLFDQWITPKWRTGQMYFGYTIVSSADENKRNDQSALWRRVTVF